MVRKHSRRKILEGVTLGVAALSGVPRASSQSADIERVGPAREVSVVPGTQVLFEVAVRNWSGDYRKYLSVDGERRFAEPDAFYGGLDRGERDVVTHAFEEEGTHSVRLELRDDGDNSLGSVEWTVRVTDDGNRPPTVERLEPRAKVLRFPANENRRRQFALRATDPDGELDRVVWWSSQCDQVIAVSSLSGSRDTASVAFDPYAGCPLWPAVVDDSGAVSWDEGWILRREDAAGHYIRIRSEGGGVATYEFTATDSVRQLGDGDTVNGNAASGHVGPERGEDLFYFQGDLAELSVDGPATVWLDGQRVDSEKVGGESGGDGEDGGNGDDGDEREDGDGTDDSDDATRRNVLEIVSEGGGVANYEFTVSGSVRQRDSGDDVNGSVVTGHVGPRRGTDAFVYTGEITAFRLTGPATVYKNGARVAPSALG